jgi:hypothetical protein
LDSSGTGVGGGWNLGAIGDGGVAPATEGLRLSRPAIPTPLTRSAWPCAPTA